MKLSYFISNRISKQSSGTFSTTINRIAVISVSIGLTVLMIAFMVLYGFKAEIASKIYSFSGHLIVDKYTLSSSFEESSIDVSDSLVNELRSYELTNHIQPYAMKAGLIRALGAKDKKDPEQVNEVQGVIMKGVDHRFDTTTFKKHMKEGGLPRFIKGEYSTEVAVSQKIANYLELKVGQDVMIYFVQNPPRYRKLTVTGIYQTGLEEFDEKIIIGDLAMIQRINGWNENQAGGIEVFIDDISKLEVAESDLFNSLDVNLYVDKVTDKYVQIFDWLGLLNRNVVILLTIILFVAGTSIISIMLILIMERTQMIGTLKSLGASNRLIRTVFVWNGIRLIIKGLLWGNVLGIGFGCIQYYFKIIPLDAANYYMTHVPISFDLFTILALNALILGLIGLTLFIPVRIISRIQPIKAIRFD